MRNYTWANHQAHLDSVVDQTIALRQMIVEYGDQIRSFLARKVAPDDVDELMQRVCLAMLEALNKRTDTEPSGDGAVGDVQVGGDARQTRPAPKQALPHILDPKRFLWRLTRNTVFNYYKEKRRARQLDFDPEVDSVESLEPSVSRALSRQRKLDKIAWAVTLLPVNLQMLFEGRYVYQFTIADLAEAHGLPEGTVDSRIRSARQRIQELLGTSADTLTPQRITRRRT